MRSPGSKGGEAGPVVEDFGLAAQGHQSRVFFESLGSLGSLCQDGHTIHRFLSTYQIAGKRAGKNKKIHLPTESRPLKKL